MTNFLLVLIVCILLFGAGSVLGFFSIIFWLLVGISIVAGIIWLIKQTPTIVKEEIEEQKIAFKKHPNAVIVVIFFVVGFFLLWLIAYVSKEQGSINPYPTKQNTNNYVPGLTTTEVSSQSQTEKVDYQSKKGYAFPIANRNEFIQSCVKDAGSELKTVSSEYCTCALKYLELNYSFNELKSMEQEYIKTNKLPKGLTDAFTTCLNKLRNNY